MGADIHSFAEVKKEGKWHRVTEKVFDSNRTTEPFGWRSYGMFGFLANVRNYSHVPCIKEPVGFPDDSEWLNSPCDYYDFMGDKQTNRQNIEGDYDYHSKSFLTLKELLGFNYEQSFEDRRFTEVTTLPGGGILSNGASVAEPGNGTMTTFKEFLGHGFFECIEELKSLGDPEDVRVIFYFDN